MTNKIHYKFALSLLTLTIAAACTKREVPVTQHEGPRSADEVVYAPTTEQIDYGALSNIDPHSLEAKLLTTQKSSQNTQDYIDTLESLAPFILDRLYVEDLKVTSSPKMREALTVFMRTLVGDATVKGLVQIDPKKASDWIEKTRIVIESGCNGTGLGCSTNILRFFRRDGGSAKVLEQSAREIDQQMDKILPENQNSPEFYDLVRVYYRRLKMAYELKNMTLDSDLELLYLSRASSYAKAFEDKNQTARDLELLKQHVEVFEIILNGFQPDLSNPQFKEKFEKFVNNFGPWQYSRRVENPFGKSATKMLTFAAQNFLYVGGKLSPSLKRAIDASQVALPKPENETSAQFSEKTFSSFESPISTTIQYIKKNHTDIWNSLHLSDSFVRDEYFFIIDRIFGDHLTIEDATEVWKGTKRNSSTILKTAEEYVKIQIAAQVIRTNKHMAKIYSNRDWSSKTLLINSIEQSYPVETQWNQLLSRIDLIHSFLDRNLKSTDDIWSDSNYNRIDKMFSSIRRNIKYISVYPNMMMMAYYMAEAKFKIPIYTFFGKYDIDASTIISWFFDGRLNPFFNFGNDGVELKRIETLYAFLFALKTDTFSSFLASRGEQFDVVKFFESVITKYLDQDRVETTKEIDNIRAETRKSTLTTFLKTCEQDRSLIKQGIKPGTKGARLPIDLWAFQYSTYTGSGATNSYGDTAFKFFTSERADTIRNLNSSLRKKLDFVQMMIDLLEEHLVQSGTSKTQVAAIKSKIKQYGDQLRNLRTEYLTELVGWNKTLSNCIDQAVTLEIDRQDTLIEKEAAHLRYVWAKMQEARGSKNKEQILASLNQFIHESMGAKSVISSKPFIPKSVVTEDNYVYADLDVMLRMVQYLKEIAPNVDIIMPSDLSDFSVWKTDKRRVIPYSSSEDDFVKTGLKNFGNESGSIMLWVYNSSSPEVFINREKINTELFKIGKFQVYDTAAESCRGQDNITTCPIRDEQITAADLVKGRTRLLQFLSMTKANQLTRDAKIMDLIGSTYRWDPFKLKGFILDQKSDPLSVFESIIDDFQQDQTLLDEAKDFHTTSQSIGDFLFAPEAPYQKVVSNNFNPLVKKYFGQLNDLLTAVTAAEKYDASTNSILNYTYEIKPTGYMTIHLIEKNGQPNYLSPLKREDAINAKKLFDLETGNAFAN